MRILQLGAIAKQAGHGDRGSVAGRAIVHRNHRCRAIQHARISIGVGGSAAFLGVASQQSDERSIAQYGILLSQVRQGRVVRLNAGVGRAIDGWIARLIEPRIRRPRVRIADGPVAAAGQRRRIHRHFIAVIHHGRADVGELEQCRQLQTLLGLHQARCRPTQSSHRARD